MADDSMRSLNSFGVAGLLVANCDVFYSNDLRGRNVGRVSDLISAKLREADVDELRIRALLAYGVFQSYAIRGLANRHSEEVPAVAVEVGVDANYVAIGVAFHWEGSHPPKWQGLAERIAAGQAAGPFERAVEWIDRHSTQVIVRYETKEKRVEIVSLLNRLNGEAKDPIAVVAVDSHTAPLLEVENYTELGDLDFAKLLKNPSLGEMAAKEGAGPRDAVEETRIAGGGGEDPDAEIRVIGGAAAERAIERRFAGKTDATDRVEELETTLEEYERTLAGLRGTVKELTAKLEARDERTFSRDGADAPDERPIVVKGGTPAPEENRDDWGFHFLKQVWPFGKESPEPPRLTEEEAHTVSTVESPVEAAGSPEPAAEEGEVAHPAGQALEELRTLANSVKSKKVQETLEEIAEEVETEKARRWVDNLSSELLLEKAKLSELQKNLAKQMRLREQEFKTAERVLKQELNKKDELLRQRQTMLDSKTEQIAQLNLAVERAGAASSDKEQQQVKAKLDRAQRMAQMKEEEAKALVVKVRDLENRLIIAQAKAQKGNDLQMQTKVQGLEKKLEEYKRVNQRLMESLNQQKDRSNDKEIGDLRRKIDQLERLANDSKRNLDKSSFKLRELQESERKLQSDLARAVDENRNLRKSQGGRGSGESGGQAA